MMPTPKRPLVLASGLTICRRRKPRYVRESQPVFTLHCEGSLACHIGSWDEIVGHVHAVEGVVAAFRAIAAGVL